MVAGVAQEWKLKRVLVDELAMRLRRVGADADGLRASRLQARRRVAEVACLGGASRGHILGIKVKHQDAASGEFLERDRLAARVGKLEGRSLAALHLVIGSLVGSRFLAGGRDD